MSSAACVAPIGSAFPLIRSSSLRPAATRSETAAAPKAEASLRVTTAIAAGNRFGLSPLGAVIAQST